MKHSKSQAACKSIAATLITSLLMSSAHADTKPPAFEMAVISDMSQGYRIMNGAFESAIQKLSPNGSGATGSFEKDTNLCVAYTKSKALSKALAACESALHIAETDSISTLNRRNVEEYRRRELLRNHSMALSNHGVLLAIGGDIDLARQTFETALTVDDSSRFAKINLAKLDAMQ